MIIDFHSHILPGIDDGAKNVDESVRLLDMMADDGVDIVVATPHFYCSRQSIHGFLEKRAESFDKLKGALRPEHPKILLGAEVLYNKALIDKDALSRLTIESTGFMLLEMPYTELDASHAEGIDTIISELDIKVIVAHIERYLEYTSFASLCDILDLGLIGQINAESLAHFGSRRECFKLVKNGYVQVMGTDMHRVERGYASYGEGAAVLRKKFGEEFLSQIERNGRMILADKTAEEIVG